MEMGNLKVKTTASSRAVELCQMPIVGVALFYTPKVYIV